MDRSLTPMPTNQVHTLVQTFAEGSLELNISKTMELYCGLSRKNPDPFETPQIRGLGVEQVEAFKYLRIEMDTCLSFWTACAQKGSSSGKLR